MRGCSAWASGIAAARLLAVGAVVDVLLAKVENRLLFLSTVPGLVITKLAND
jgi:hypothetical protein